MRIRSVLIASVLAVVSIVSIANADVYTVKSVVPFDSQANCFSDSSVYNLYSPVGQQVNVDLDSNHGVLVTGIDKSSAAFATYRTGIHKDAASPAGGRGVTSVGKFNSATQLEINEVDSDGFVQKVTLTFNGDYLKAETVYTNTSGNYSRFQTCILEK